MKSKALKDQFVTQEIANDLVSLGFNEKGMLAFYKNNKLHFFKNPESQKSQKDCKKGETIAPLRQQVIDWLWDKHFIAIMQDPNTTSFCYRIHHYGNLKKRVWQHIDLPGGQIKMRKSNDVQMYAIEDAIKFLKTKTWK